MVCHSQWDTTFCVLFSASYVSSVKQRIINTSSNLLNQIKLPKMCDRYIQVLPSNQVSPLWLLEARNIQLYFQVFFYEVFL